MTVVKKLITLNESISKELDILSKVLNKTQREIIENALDFYFDYTDGVVADKITKEIRDRKMKVLESKEVYEKLGIEIQD